MHILSQNMVPTQLKVKRQKAINNSDIKEESVKNKTVKNDM